MEWVYRNAKAKIPTAIDHSGLNHLRYGAKTTANLHRIILDHEGKIVFNYTLGWSMGGKQLWKMRLDEALARAPGIFGIDKVPAGLEPLMEMVSLGQFGAAGKMLSAARRSAAGGTPEGKAFIDKVSSGIAAFKAARLAEIESLVEKGEKWKAYKLAESFVRTFGYGKEVSKVKRIMSSLKTKPPVKNELAARRVFLIVQKLVGSPKAKERTQGKLGLMQIMKAYPETEFGRAAKTVKDGLAAN